MDTYSYQPDSSTFLGILYAEDFDDPAPAPTPRVVAAPVLTQDDVDRACIASVASAQREWESSHAREKAELLAKVAHTLAETRAEAERTALAIAEHTVATMLSILMRALPGLCSGHGPEEVRHLVTHLLPTLRAEPQVTIRVHADLVPDLQQCLSEIEHEAHGAITVVAANIARGDLKVSWANGSMIRDTAQVQQAMQDALSMLGLQLPVETLPKRSMAHAE